MLLLLLCILPEDSEARLDKLMQPNSSLFLQTVSLMRSPHCLKSSSVRSQDRLWRMSGCLSPDGGNSPEVVPAYTPGVNGESEVAAPLHETHVRDEDQVDGRDGLTDL